MSKNAISIVFLSALLMCSCNSAINDVTPDPWVRYDSQKEYVENKLRKGEITAAQAARLKQIAFNAIIGETPITEAYWGKLILVGEKVDKKLISANEAQAIDKQLWAQTAVQIKQMQALDSQINANNSYAYANNAVSNAAAINMLQNRNSNYNSFDQSQQLTNALNAPVNTNCYGYGSNANCSSQRRSAIPFTQPPSMPFN